MKIEKQTAFVKKCLECEEKTYIRLWWEIREATKNSICEDDGALIIQRGKSWCCFSIGQDEKLKVQKERIVAVLTFLGMEKHIPKCAPSDEDIEREEEDDEDSEWCSCCGRPR